MATESVPFRANRSLQLIVAWLVLVWVVTAIEPLYPRDWLLENLLVFISAALLIGSYRRFRFSNLSYGLFAVFMTLHLIGAHYTYAETPAGFWVQSWFDLERNHYDRFVHFGFGLLLAWPIRELLLRESGATRRWSAFFAVNCILAMSALYEVIEGITAMIVSPELGSAYLGTQGDEWDAQKDSALAFIGAAIAILVGSAYVSKRGESTLGKN